MRLASYANRGRPFEELLNYIHAGYQSSGIACIHKVPTEFIPLRDHKGRVCNVKVEHKSCVDYLGRYRGIPVAIEAKHTEGNRIPFAQVQDHQADYMDDFCKDQRAVGIVVVSFSLRRFFAVPWPFWRIARKQWASGKGKSKKVINAYGWQWTTPGMASVSAEQLLPEWEVKAGAYLELIDRMGSNLAAGGE